MMACLISTPPSQASALQTRPGLRWLMALLLCFGVMLASPAPASSEGRKLYIPIGSERLLSFDVPFGQISVADPKVIEALPFTQKKLNLIARAFGSTVVLVLGEDGVTTLASYDVQVGPDLAQLKKSLWRLAPGAQIELNFVNTSLQIQGSVPDTKTEELIVSAAEEMTGTKPISALQIQPNASLIEDALQRLVPGADVQIDYVNDAVQMRGSAPNEETKKLLEAAVKAITGQDPVSNLVVDNAEQVTLKVRVIEVSRSLEGDLGLYGAGATGQKTFGSSAGDSPVTTLLQIAADMIARFTLISPTINIDLYLKLLEEQGYAKYLAEPTLTALSGESAEFHAGGEVQIVTGTSVDEDGQVTRKTEFKQFGTSLKFTPTVKIDGRIKLLLEPEVSSIDNINKYNDLDTFDVRRAKTTVEMENNQTLIIAGLYQKRQDRRKKQVPGLGGLRGLGNLFRRSDSRDDETQILFVVTPSYDVPDEAQQRRSVAAFEAANAADAKDFYLRGYMERGFDVNDLMQGVGVTGRFGPMISSGGQGVFRAD